MAQNAPKTAVKERPEQTEIVILDDETEERLNAALWRYSERVATLVETTLDEYVRQL